MKVKSLATFKEYSEMRMPVAAAIDERQERSVLPREVSNRSPPNSTVLQGLPSFRRCRHGPGTRLSTGFVRGSCTPTCVREVEARLRPF
jgi:hypothetical protein